MVWRRWPVNVKALVRTVNHTLKSHNLFPENSRILVACSGGPDSMALLHLLKDIAIHRHTTYEIGVAIVDHCIRPESKEEVLWLQHQVEELGLPFYSATFDVPRLSKEHKKSEETIGRQVRYQWLNEIAQSEGYDYISVAHHKDDQAESILAHLIRGTGLNGLTGMAVVSNDYDIPVIRPLLDVPKEELLAYLADRKLTYCIDSTNDDIRYQRNRIRHRIIPELEAVNPAVVDAIVRLGSSVNEDVMVISDLTSRTFDKLVSIGKDEVRISRRALRQEPLAIQRRLWQRLVSTIDSDLTLTSAHQEQLLDIVNTGEEKTFTIKSIKVTAQCDTIKIYCEH
ncbi:MAG: tRNA lysidine(34) synthetase TilS [Veillonella dispar]|uniref:tRNA lysidine(34) synthetase TilS n=1 Tax=Veillonella dispar TaxID=39778 RepID=UPI0029028064|nr:tRNA lysidine(34) synthetase TilS [Veillonella dispar]MDU1986956.1 tRNA lysidine(34) synthetase TilS [Veillonella dispar]